MHYKILLVGHLGYVGLVIWVTLDTLWDTFGGLFGHVGRFICGTFEGFIWVTLGAVWDTFGWSSDYVGYAAISIIIFDICLGDSEDYLLAWAFPSRTTQTMVFFFWLATKRSWYYSIYSYVSVFVSHFLSLHSLTHIHHTSTTHTQKQACPKLASAFFQLLIPLSFLFCFSEIYLAHPIFPTKKYWEERIGWDKYTSEKEEMSLFSFTCKEDPTYRPFCWCKRSKVNMNPEGEIHATWKRKNNSNINNIKHSSWCCFLSFSFLFPYRGN